MEKVQAPLQKNEYLVVVGTQGKLNTYQIHVNGRVLTFTQLAQQLGVVRTTVYARLRNLAPGRHVVPFAPAPRKTYIHQGKEYTGTELAGAAGISLSLLMHRLKRGKSMEDALLPAHHAPASLCAQMQYAQMQYAQMQAAYEALLQQYA